MKIKIHVPGDLFGTVPWLRHGLEFGTLKISAGVTNSNLPGLWLSEVSAPKTTAPKTTAPKTTDLFCIAIAYSSDELEHLPGAPPLPSNVEAILKELAEEFFTTHFKEHLTGDKIQDTLEIHLN